MNGRRNAGLTVPSVSSIVVLGVVAVMCALLADAPVPTASAKGRATPPLSFTIALPKRHFHAGEPLPLTMTLRNVSARGITVNRRLAINDKSAPGPFREVTLHITTPSGGEAPFLVDLRIGFPGPGDVTTLAPGRRVQQTRDIAHLYALDHKGTYAITATYQSAVSGAVQTRVDSNRLTFSIG